MNQMGQIKFRKLSVLLEKSDMFLYVTVSSFLFKAMNVKFNKGCKFESWRYALSTMSKWDPDF